MTGIAVLKVDDLGRRPLLIGGVGGIVCICKPFAITFYNHLVLPLEAHFSSEK